ncbi:MAG: methionine ABC transporter ATP-binding protein [Christensenellales bacterium]|jgi:D-methionine transport system ATP-binding protein
MQENSGAQGPIIEIKGLSKVYVGPDGDTFNALTDVNLTIERGDIFGIIGMSGAGKTTLVRCMNMLENPTSGSVIIDGKDLGKLSPKELREVRKSATMIFQHFNLLMQKTVLKNVMFPLELIGTPKDEARRRALELLEIVGMPDKANAYPAHLSGGQKQRVAIARALATNPKVLLCDEATSALDPMTTRQILELLKDINTRLGLTIVIITHEMGVIREICTKVAVIDGSRLVETGTVEQVFTRPKTASALRLFYSSDSAGVLGEGPTVRLVFEGTKAYEPILSGMINACHAPVSVLYGSIERIKGKAYGQLVIQLPADERAARLALEYLELSDVIVEGVGNNVDG